MYCVIGLEQFIKAVVFYFFTVKFVRDYWATETVHGCIPGMPDFSNS